jgi:Glycosyl transferase family 2
MAARVVSAASPEFRLAADEVEPDDLGVYLPQAIDSALAQTHPNVDVIVVDDGSTDDSREVLSAYEQRVEVVRKENGGQASALNAGFARTHGDVVIFLDADDVLRPEAAALVAGCFAADPEVVKVQYRMEVIDSRGHPSGVIKPHEHIPLPDGDVRRAELTFPFDLVWLPTSGNAFRADSLRRIFPIPEADYRILADAYLVHLTPLLGPVVSREEVAALYRVHGDNRFEPQDATLDLDRVRQAILCAAATSKALERLAGELALERRPGPILSVSDVAQRLISVKLEPDRHPLPDDRVARLVFDGIRAASRRFDVSAEMKLLMSAWFLSMAAAPAAIARPLAEAFVFPERRRRLNRVLRRYHRSRRATSR